MAIGINDVSKNAVESLPFRQDQKVLNDELVALNKQEIKKVKAAEKAELDHQRNAKNVDKDDKGNKKDELKQSPSISSDMVENATNKMSLLNVQLSFEISEDGKNDIIKVIDKETGEEVRQIPSEEFLRMSDRIDDIISELSEIKGSLVNNRV